MEDIGQSFRGLISRGFGINNIGVVVGDAAFVAASSADSPTRHAALFSKGSVSDLGTLKKQTVSRANSINGFNQVVGFSGPALDSPKSRAFFWSKSTGMVDLGTLGGAYAQAFAINDSGSITGNSLLGSSATDTNAVYAFLSPRASHSSHRALRLTLLCHRVLPELRDLPFPAPATNAPQA